MSTIKLVTICLCLLAGITSFGQQINPSDSLRKGTKNTTSEKQGFASKISISAGAGIANYFGDLMQYNRFYSQSGFSFSAGASYAFAKKFGLRLTAGVQQVKAADSKNKGAQYQARNLSFKSTVTDLSIAVDYDILDIKKHGFTPYVSAGVGVMFFNPTADGAAGKQNLRDLGTEGQGLAGYPGMYSKTAVTIPLGVGLKIAASKKITIQFDFNYRFTGTDYLDDVSTNGYPSKTLLDARNPVTAKYTWRGNEVGGESYPKNLSLPRGNPSDKDGYYTTQLKIVYKLIHL